MSDPQSAQELHTRNSDMYIDPVGALVYRSQNSAADLYSEHCRLQFVRDYAVAHFYSIALFYLNYPVGKLVTCRYSNNMVGAESDDEE